MHHGPQYHPNDIRRAENRSRRETQRRFSPGTLGVSSRVKVFTVVGWSPVAPQPRGDGMFGERAVPATWEVLVILDEGLLTWPWERLKSCMTLEEWAGHDAVP